MNRSPFGLRRAARIFFTLAIMAAGLLASHAQQHLHRTISTGPIFRQPLVSVLESISREGNFHFSFNSGRVPTDSLVSVAPFEGTLATFLQQVLGDQYGLKEVDDYVIIRHVPQRFEPKVEIESSYRGTLVVRGQILDAETRQGVSHVSVHDRHSFARALSDERGNFELTIRRPDESLWMEVSKENYRDTMIVMLMPVEIAQGGRKIRFRYFPGRDFDSLGETWLGRAFTSSKERIAHLNIGNLFAERFYQFSVLPGVGIQGSSHGRTVNNVSMSLLGGHGAGVNGVEISGLFGINKHDVGPLQVAGIFNLTGGSQRGLQVAGIANQVMGTVKGLQVAGVYNQARRVHGVQLAGLVNVADSSDYPVGLLNFIGNGKRNVALEADENLRLSASLRTGGRILYGMVGLGYALDPKATLHYGIRAGVGAHIVRGNRFSLDAEFGNTLYTDFSRVQSQYTIAVSPQVKISDRLSITAAPGLHITDGHERGIADQPRWKINALGSGNHTVLHGGVSVGLRYHFGQ